MNHWSCICTCCALLGIANVLESLGRSLSGAGDRVLLLIIIEHVREDVFGVLEPLCHLRIVAVQSLVQWHRRPLTLLVNVGHISILGVEQDLRVILEVHLDNLVAESEHDSMLGPHPLLHVDGAGRVLQLVGLVHFIPLN